MSMNDADSKSYWREDIDDNYFRKQIKFALLPLYAALRNQVEPRQPKGSCRAAQASRSIKRILENRKFTNVLDITRFLVSMDEERSANVVHIRVFKGGPISIKDLPHTIKCKHLKMELEIMAGLPTNIDYSLCFPKHNVLDDNYEITFNDNISSGALFTVQFPPLWETIVNLLSEDNPDCLIKHVRIVSDTLSEEKAEELIFCIAFLASSIGNVKTLKSLYNINGKSFTRETIFKRSCAHSAAHQDNISVLYELNQSRLDLTKKDIFGKTPCDIAESVDAKSSVRFFRELIKNRAGLINKNLLRVQKTPDEGDRDTESAIQSRRINSAPSTLSRRQRKVGWSADTDSGIEVSSFADTKLERPSSSVSNMTKGSTCRTVILEDWELDFLRNCNLESQKKLRYRKENSKMNKNVSTERKVYYKTKYHTGENKETDWSKRPANADSRFRTWKTWLLEEEKTKEVDEERQLFNAMAYQKWLDRKRKKGLLQSKNDEGPKAFVNPLAQKKIDYRKTPTRDILENNSTAYENWMESKQDYFYEQKLMKREKEAEIAVDPIAKQKIEKTKISIFSLVDTGHGNVQIPTSSTYKDSYKNWQSTNSFQKETSKPVSREDIKRWRKNLRKNGMMYEEWCQLKRDEDNIDRPPRKPATPQKTFALTNHKTFIVVHNE
ncbi:DgyrCDS5916 [Dimorphilus gyrociliatus]|uniref:DgyrCDS5916 n=1 Tax=Dimorphilus gyrociliatus TaxID=2664684 RepID=A0A7I8VM68_9ANNE|nr:DgyrCDS5916 [Dimorphilus gyrociliatus]